MKKAIKCLPSHEDLWGHHPPAIDPLVGYAGMGAPQYITILPSSTAAGQFFNEFNADNPNMDRITIWGGTPAPANAFEYLTEEPGVLDWNIGNLGNMDRSMQAAAILTIPSCEFEVTPVVCDNTNVMASLIGSPKSGVTYSWALLNNTSGASPTSGSGTSFNLNSGNQAGSVTVQLTASVAFGGSTIEVVCDIRGTSDVDGGEMLLGIDCEGIKDAPIVKPVAPGRGKPKMDVYPNPFRNQTNITFSVESDSRTVVEVFTLQGSRVAVLFDEPVRAEEVHTVTFSPEVNANRQIYLVVIRTDSGQATRQIIAY